MPANSAGAPSHETQQLGLHFVCQLLTRRQSSGVPDPLYRCAFRENDSTTGPPRKKASHQASKVADKSRPSADNQLGRRNQTQSVCQRLLQPP